MRIATTFSMITTLDYNPKKGLSNDKNSVERGEKREGNELVE